MSSLNYSIQSIQENSENSKFLDYKILDCNETPFENQTLEEKSLTITKILQEANFSLTNANNSAPSFISKRTSNGGTGHTQICSLSRKVFQKAGINESSLPEFSRVPETRDDEKSLLFILKLLNRETAQNEQFCSRFYTLLGMKAPELLFIGDLNIPGTNKKTAIRAIDFFEKAAKTVIPDNSELVFMYAFEATDLDSLLKQKTLFDLNKDCFTKMIKNIGEVAIMDLLISNGDRFFHYEEDPSKLQNSFCNDGNIMFQLVSKRNQRELKQTFIIDNSASSKLWPTGKILEEDDDYDFSIFEPENLTKEESLSSVSKSDTVESSLPVPDSFPYLELFKYYTDVVNHEEFAEIIINGLFSKIKPSLPEESMVDIFFTDETFIKTTLIKGFKKSIKKLKKLNTNELLNFEQEETKSKKNCQTILDLIKCNINYIQQRG